MNAMHLGSKLDGMDFVRYLDGFPESVHFIFLWNFEAYPVDDDPIWPAYVQISGENHQLV